MSIPEVNYKKVMFNAGHGFFFGSCHGLFHYIKNLPKPDPKSTFETPASVQTNEAAQKAFKHGFLFSGLAAVFTLSSELLASSREVKDVYNSVAAGAISGVFATIAMQDFTLKGVTKKVGGLAVCGAFYHQFAKLEDEEIIYKHKYGRELTLSEKIYRIISLD